MKLRINLYSTILFIQMLLLLTFIQKIESKNKIRQINESNFQQFSKDNSYWILQIYSQNCVKCRDHQNYLVETAQLLQGICKIGKVNAKFLKGTKITNNPTYLFLRSNKIQENVQFSQKKVSRNSLAKFCLAEVEKFVKKRNKQLFGNKKQSEENSRPQQTNQKKSNYNNKNVIELNDNQFQKSVLRSKQAWFILFYSPSCGHCKNLEPQFIKLPGIMGKKVKIAKIDSTVNRKYTQQYQIKGFPTMILFQQQNKQNPLTYQGQRTAEDIKNWLNTKNLSKQKKQLHDLSKQQYNNLCNRNIICLLLIVQSKTQKSKLHFIKPLLQEIVQKPIQFFFSQKISLLQSTLMIEDKKTPKIIAIWEGIQSYRIYNGANNQEQLRQFIQNLMQRRKWIKFEQKSADLLFEKRLFNEQL